MMRLPISSLRPFVVFFLVSLAAAADKEPLTHADYDQWNSLRQTTISHDGRWVACVLDPQFGDGTLIVKEVEGDREWIHERGTRPAFTADGLRVVFRVEPSKTEKRERSLAKLRREAEEKKRPKGEDRPKKEKEEDPKPALAVLDLETGEVELIERVMRFSVPRDQSILVYHLEKPEEKKPEEEKDDERSESGERGEKPGAEKKKVKQEGKGEEKEKEKKDPLEEKRQDGTTLVVRDLATGEETKYEGVASYNVSRKGRWLILSVSTKKLDPGIAHGFFVVDFEDRQKTTLLDGAAHHTNPTWTREETALVFASDLRDLEAEEPEIDLYLWQPGDEEARRIVSCVDEDFPEARRIKENGLSFSRDGSVLVLALGSEREEDPPPILPEERISLDIWHWQDGMIQTMQAKQASRLRDPSFTAVWHRSDERLVVLGDEEIPSVRLITDDGALAFATTNGPYEAEVTWDGFFSDVYLVNTIDGKRTRFVERQRGGAQPSPTGAWVAYFGDDCTWHLVNTETLEDRSITADLEVSFNIEDDDHPAPARAYGLAGWTPGDKHVLLYDRYDIWKIEAETGNAVCLTDSLGRSNHMVFRLSRIDPEAVGDDDERDRFVPSDLLLSARDEDTMASGFWMESLEGVRKARRLTMQDKACGRVSKARDAKRFFFTLSTFEEFPDLWTSGPGFSDMRKLTHANPQQADHLWGRAELVEWFSGDGVLLKGKLVKPEGFDPSKKYPMLVYFYERRSQSLHSYVAPAPGTSPNASYYVSNGYLWFEPDIVYSEGYPGDSCFKCVVSGVQSLLAKGFVDETAIGIAGHSWGGYQTAYLVTRTSLFAAAESGAPVSNMFSAYGGIRWGSGMSRQFQYEMSQSRIGGTPWTHPMRYWENSPLFFADKVRTPVLILHNDNDGAVPWYQGIEYFMALRRLGKEAYLFNYNAEGHGLRKRANRKDWTWRMQAFFDHHLKKKKAPEWMREGVPYVERELEKLPKLPFGSPSAGDRQ